MNKSLEWVRSADPGAVRRAAGIKQVTMAAALGCGRPELANWEAARRRVPPRYFGSWRRVTEGLARHLEIPESAR